ncbi:hypothetical protein P7266_0350 [Lactococcus cremoris]|nr:hypothetical protein P7266_0350 [Lactococcus cremoris]
MGTPKKVYDVFVSGKFVMTGTQKEIAERFGYHVKTISHWAMNGKLPEEERKLKKSVAIVNKEETKKLVAKHTPETMGRKRSHLNDAKLDEERRKYETKEERRLRRNIRAQMAIENSRKDDSVFK